MDATKTPRELELEALLRSACCIAERNGSGTDWARFIKSVNAVGLNGVTARTYRDLDAVGTSEAARKAAQLELDNEAEVYPPARFKTGVAVQKAIDAELDRIAGPVVAGIQELFESLNHEDFKIFLRVEVQQKYQAVKAAILNYQNKDTPTRVHPREEAMTHESNRIPAAPRMSRIDLLEMLTKRARKFRKDRDYYTRNSHMHDIVEAPPQEVVDAVLVGFINDIGIMQGVDYALYARDLANEA